MFVSNLAPRGGINMSLLLGWVRGVDFPMLGVIWVITLAFWPAGLSPLVDFRCFFGFLRGVFLHPYTIILWFKNADAV